MLFFVCVHKQRVHNCLVSFLYEVKRLSLGSFAAVFCQSVCSLDSGNASMCWHPLEHYSVVV